MRELDARSGASAACEGGLFFGLWESAWEGERGKMGVSGGV